MGTAAPSQGFDVPLAGYSYGLRNSGKVAGFADEDRALGRVIAVASAAQHGFSKTCRDSIELLAGLGVSGDAHMGATVKHRSRVRKDATQPNLRQVHLIHGELIETLQSSGFSVAPGTMGENITTCDLDLLNLPTDTRLAIGDSAVIRLTGLRNPCAQLDGYQKGLTAAVLDRDEHGELVRLAGVMGVVIEGGTGRRDDPVQVLLPTGPRKPLAPV